MKFKAVCLNGCYSGLGGDNGVSKKEAWSLAASHGNLYRHNMDVLPIIKTFLVNGKPVGVTGMLIDDTRVSK